MATRGKPANSVRKGARKRSSSAPSPSPSVRASLVDIAQQVRSWTDSVLGVAGAAADVTLGTAKLMLPKPGQRAALERSGAVLRRLREAAGVPSLMADRSGGQHVRHQRHQRSRNPSKLTMERGSAGQHQRRLQNQ